MPSQYGEHLTILEYFEKLGPRREPRKFLDVGAFDFKTFSNTLPLAEAGWAGTLVEPSPQAFCWLMVNSHRFTGLNLVNAALAPLPGGLGRFHANTRGDQTMAADAMSTFDPDHRWKFEKDGQPYREIWIPTIGWPELWMVAGEVDFINIDVEGMNAQLLECLPFDKFKPKMVCIEIDPEEALPSMCGLLERNGLGKQERCGGNLLAWRK